MFGKSIVLDFNKTECPWNVDDEKVTNLLSKLLADVFDEQNYFFIKK